MFSALWHWQFFQWRRGVERSSLPKNPAPDFTAIILSYKRPQNIAPICRALLMTPSIDRIIVSSNNPAIDLDQWLTHRDLRIELIIQSERKHTSERFLIARTLPGPYFLCVDDDLFLYPSQLETVCNTFRQDTSVPLGIVGQRFDPQTHTFQCDLHEEPVDGLNRVYACTKDHVVEFFRIAALLGVLPGSPGWLSSMWDDMVLSRSGKGAPHLVTVGPYLDCPTQGKQGIAAWREPGFFEERATLWHKLERIKPF